MTSFFEHQRFSFKRNYLRNLIVLASADGSLDREEIDLLFKIGKKRGLKDWQIEDTLNDNSTHQIFMPESQANRMNLLYDFMEIIYADGEVNEKEVAFIYQIVISFNLPTTIASDLINMFNGGAPTPVEWLMFVESVTSGAANEKLLVL